MKDSQADILVIEDNMEVRDNLSEILTLYGYCVRTAANGLEGSKAAIEHLPDLILCDVMMPELDGFGVLNLLSQNERTAGIPFVFITARTETEYIRRGMNLGADDYITKPFYKDELLQVVRTRLQKATVRANQSHTPNSKVHLSDPKRGLALLEESFTTDGRTKSYDEQSTIVREGEHPHFLFRVTEGHVHLARTHEHGRSYIIAEIGTGELFGLSSALEKTPYHYTARAASGPVQCQLLPASKLTDLLSTHRAVTEALMHLLAGRAVGYSEHLVHQAYDSVRRRTALVLCDLHQRYGEKSITLSRLELAQMVGSTKESVTRALSDFKRADLLQTDGRDIHILAAADLRSLLV